jgi:large subunit ribosomal protein L9
MAKTVELLLTETVESLGIVGDVVKVRTGFARNYLLPRAMATTPSEEKIKALATKRADAERHVAEMRQAREQLIEKLEGVEVTLERSCNDQGLLYGSVTQQDVATALNAMGFAVRPRDVRLQTTIKRIDSYDVPIKPESDLEAVVKLWVVADRELNLEKDREERHFDEKGDVVEKAAEAEAHEGGEKKKGGKKKAEHAEEAAPAEEKPAKKAKKAKAE